MDAGREEPFGTGLERRVIALEFNELCPSLLERWMADGSLPGFKQLHDSSEIFTTEADVDDPTQLEPWIQWYSVHTGLSAEQHQVFHLTDGSRASHRDIWRSLADAGYSVFSFASMNVRPFAVDGSVFVGDPWCEAGDAHPPELNAYNRFVGHSVREYSNEDQPLSLKDHAAFLGFLISHGLSARTVTQILSQLTTEKVRGSHLSYRRVSILDALQYDVFAHYYRRLKPDFATFFINSVAHLQHSYWRYMEPESFDLKPSEEEIARYGGAIKEGYVALDRLLQRFLKLARRHGATLILQTALSQQPFTKYDQAGGQRFYRLRDVKDFLSASGIEYQDVSPTMTSQYMVTFADNAGRDAARARIESYQYADGRSMFDFAQHETDRGLYFAPLAPRQEGLSLDSSTGRRFAHDEILYAIEGMKSGCHHRSGALWIATGTHRRHEEAVSILDLFPTLLETFSCSADPAARQGRSLLHRMRQPAIV